MILIDSQPKTTPTILGELTEEFVVNNALLKQIIVNPATASTTYDVEIVDVNTYKYYEETNCEGEFNQLVDLPIYGNITVNIKNSSVDESYNVIMTFRRS